MISEICFFFLFLAGKDGKDGQNGKFTIIQVWHDTLLETFLSSKQLVLSNHMSFFLLVQEDMAVME